MKLYLEGTTTTLKKLIKINNPFETDGLTKEEIKNLESLKINEFIYIGQFIKVTRI